MWIKFWYRQIFEHPWTFPGVMLGPTQYFGPIGSSVFTFIGYKHFSYLFNYFKLTLHFWYISFLEIILSFKCFSFYIFLFLSSKNSFLSLSPKYIYTLLVWVSVCFYPINVQTAEPIGPPTKFDLHLIFNFHKKRPESLAHINSHWVI